MALAASLVPKLSTFKIELISSSKSSIPPMIHILINGNTLYKSLQANYKVPSLITLPLSLFPSTQLPISFFPLLHSFTSHPLPFTFYP